MKLFHKYLLFGLLPATLISVIASAIISQIAINNFRQALDLSAKLEMDYYGGQIENYFSKQLVAVQAVADNPLVQQKNLKDILAFLKHEEKRLVPEIEGLYFNDLDANVYGTRGEKFNVRDREYYPAEVRGEIVFSSPLISRATNQRVIVLLVPIFNENHVRVGSVGATITSEKLFKQIEHIPVGRQGIVTLVNNFGKNVVKIGLPDNLPKELLDNKQGSFSGLTPKQLNQLKPRYLVKKKKIAPVNWELTIIKLESEIYGPQLFAYKFNAFLFCSVLIAGSLFSLWIVRRLLYPLKQIVQKQELLTHGDMKARVENLKLDDELGAIGRSFNTMAEALALRQAELRQKNKELEDVIHVASHDLRSPLINLQGFSTQLAIVSEQLENLPAHQNLKESELQFWQDYWQKFHKALKFIQLSTKKMDTLIEGLLRVSRAGRLEPRLKSCNVNDLLDEIIKVLSYQIAQADAQIKIESLPSCTGDPALLSQIFHNLFDNALKYRRPDSPLIISISGKIVETMVIYTVADTGRGIAPNHQANVWNIFHRLNPEEDIPGEGLGLALVRRLVELQGGKIWLESVLNEGTSFFISLPIALRKTTPTHVS